MQKMMLICERYCHEYCLSFNSSKSKTLIFGPAHDKITPAPLYLANSIVEYVTEWKYLGCLIIAGKETVFKSRNNIAAFRRSANSIVTSIKKPNEHVLMMLLYTFSVPILTYACEVKQFSCTEMRECHVALNDAITSVTQLSSLASGDKNYRRY